MRQIFVFLLILVISTFSFSISPNEAVNIVSTTNNYLFDNENAVIISPQVQIKYSEKLYWVVAGAVNDSVGVYIPVSDTGEVASGPIEVRELISTEIVVDKISNLRNSYPASDWPFSHPVKNRFFDIENSLRNLSPSISNVIVDLEKINGASSLVTSAKKVKKEIDDLGLESIEIAQLIDDAILFERDYLSNPVTSDTKKYEDLFVAYFNKINSYKNNYNSLSAELDSLRQGIGSFQGSMENSQKEFYLSVLRLPNQTTALNSFFTLNDTTKTLVEEIFISSKNIENFVLNLETRKNRNSAWLVLYGRDETISKLNGSFNNLNDAATAILLEENVNFWKNQDNISALKVNYRQAVENYNKGIYDKSVNFGNDAKKNVRAILTDGFNEVVDTSSDLVLQIIILLVIILVVVFLAEKFYFNKKKEKINEYYEEEYYEN